MTMQDTASGVALWRQVADGIERGIADGSFAAGERLPGEGEIPGTYRVNRPPLRRARPPRRDCSELAGPGAGEPRGQLIGASEEPATRELARQLALKTGAPLIRI